MAKEKQPGEFRRWGRNHKNSASGCHSHFTAEGAGLQTSGKAGLECAGCIWNSSSKMRCQPPWIGRAAATDRSRDSSEDSRCLRESGGIGRRARLRIWCRKAWGFESPLSHSPVAPFCDREPRIRSLLSTSHNSQSPGTHYLHSRRMIFIRCGRASPRGFQTCVLQVPLAFFGPVNYKTEAPR